MSERRDGPSGYDWSVLFLIAFFGLLDGCGDRHRNARLDRIERHLNLPPIEAAQPEGGSGCPF